MCCLTFDDFSSTETTISTIAFFCSSAVPSRAFSSLHTMAAIVASALVEGSSFWMLFMIEREREREREQLLREAAAFGGEAGGAGLGDGEVAGAGPPVDAVAAGRGILLAVRERMAADTAGDVREDIFVDSSEDDLADGLGADTEMAGFLVGGAVLGEDVADLLGSEGLAFLRDRYLCVCFEVQV